ncbi:MAG: AAA family ATPase [Gammaproteobacteria bacterium]|jgi:MoxR-like ATPase
MNAEALRQTEARSLADQLVAEVGRIILGKDDEIRLCLTCLLAHGHLLIEDVPGVGKTLLARALATVLDLRFSRIQFTSDLMPADVIGVSVFKQDDSSFEFHEGPLFANLVLADEVNRATPKSQSALLEAMEEHQVTIDGATRALPDPFFVMATQNPIHQIGTYPLPESQLDRFLMRIGLGYPTEELERSILKGDDRRAMLGELRPLIGHDGLLQMQTAARATKVSEALLDYVQALVRYTRTAAEYELGLSPRGSQDLVAASRAWAFINGHAGVHPEDVQAVFSAVTSHRLRLRPDLSSAQQDAGSLALESVAIP